MTISFYTYTINVARNNGHGVYVHYFRIKDPQLIKDEIKGLTSELSLIYPDPDYQITVYRNTNTSKKVEI